MVIPDVNVLIYAYNPDAPQHGVASAWLEKQFAGRDVVGFTWPAIWGFTRIMSNRRLFRNPPLVEAVLRVVEEWLALPNVVLVQPGQRHFSIWKALMLGTEAFNSLASDAVLAALAIEHAATFVSTDRDFGRFSGLKWIDLIP